MAEAFGIFGGEEAAQPLLKCRIVRTDVEHRDGVLKFSTLGVAVFSRLDTPVSRLDTRVSCR